MSLRKAHGAGAPALVRAETLPVDELPALNAGDTAEGLALAAQRGRPFQRGNRAAAGRKPSLASATGIPANATDPAYRKALAWARAYRRRRVSELAIQHGGQVSAGVCALVTSASIDMASSRYLSAVAASTGDPAMMKLASSLSQAARTAELTALEIATREAAARPKVWRDPLEHLMTADEKAKLLK